MTLLELQTRIAEHLNADETLKKGDCKAFAEDSMTVENDVAVHMQEAVRKEKGLLHDDRE